MEQQIGCRLSLNKLSTCLSTARSRAGDRWQVSKKVRGQCFLRSLKSADEDMSQMSLRILWKKTNARRSEDMRIVFYFAFKMARGSKTSKTLHFLCGPVPEVPKEGEYPLSSASKRMGLLDERPLFALHHRLGTWQKRSPVLHVADGDALLSR